MAKELTLEEALVKVEELKAENKSLTADNKKSSDLNGALEQIKEDLQAKVDSLQSELEETQESALAEITELKEKFANLQLQKNGELPVVKITSGQYEGHYQFTSASFKLKGEQIKAIEVKNDSDVLITLVRMQAGVIKKIK